MIGYVAIIYGEQSSGVGSREARLSPMIGWQVRDERLTAYDLLYFIYWLTLAPHVPVPEA